MRVYFPFQGGRYAIAELFQVEEPVALGFRGWESSFFRFGYECGVGIMLRV